jgi:hypothetical protein
VSKSRQIAKAKIMALVFTTAVNCKGGYWRDQPKDWGGDADGQEDTPARLLYFMPVFTV